MYKKIVIIVVTLIIVVSIISFIIWKKTKTVNTNNNQFINHIQYATNMNDEKGNKIQNIIKDTSIQGIVYLKYNGEITITENQYFGELGYRIEEYSFAVFKNKNQTCIDYFTMEKYDTSYIDIGDILICTGDLIKFNNRGDNLETNKNEIIVLKQSDYEKMKKEILNGQRNTVITVGELYLESQYFYLKYDIVDNTHSDRIYHFPFIQKVYITDKTKITGELEKGIKVEVQYNNLNNYTDGLILNSIKAI